jgi:CBS domain-containing protein
MLTAKHVMTKNVVNILSGTTLREAAQLLLDRRISGAPVVSADGELVGIISEYNLLEMVYVPQLGSRPVDEFLTKEVFTVDVDTDLSQVANFFIMRRIRRVPVLDKGRLVGIISRPELLRSLLEATDRDMEANAVSAAQQQLAPSGRS